MSGTQKIQLDEFVDPFEVNLEVRRDSDGIVTEVVFDLSGLPRVDSMLVGKPATELPDITKRLCGICPVVHHLAGIAAVESLYGIDDIPATAQAIRNLLACGSALDSLVAKYITHSRDFAISLKRVGKQLMAIAGSPTHFPDVAIPGGVRAPAVLDDALDAIEKLRKLISEVSGLIDEAASAQNGGATQWQDSFIGADVAVVKRNGELDQLGGWLAVKADGRIDLHPAEEWGSAFRELLPGEAAPRPVVSVREQELLYRVGPLARCAVAGQYQTTPELAQLLSVRDYAKQALRLLQSEELAGHDIVNPHAEMAIASATWDGPRTGVGLIDGPRGLLVHSYTAGADGLVTECQIMTPTAQNEPWLAQMLSAQYLDSNGLGDEVEDSIRMADPCLPCSSAPEGLMKVRVHQS